MWPFLFVYIFPILIDYLKLLILILDFHQHPRKNDVRVAIDVLTVTPNLITTHFDQQKALVIFFFWCSRQTKIIIKCTFAVVRFNTKQKRQKHFNYFSFWCIKHLKYYSYHLRIKCTLCHSKTTEIFEVRWK